MLYKRGKLRMNAQQVKAYMNIKKEMKIPFKIAVSGISMNRLLKQDDIITVQSADSYNIGDILLFDYGTNDFRVHRLLEVEDGEYRLKGDNSFLIEIISFDKIIGRVINAKRGNTDINIVFSKNKLNQIIKMSREINKKFEHYKRDLESIKSTILYKKYYDLFLKEF
jgi:hypothetical protein